MAEEEKKKKTPKTPSEVMDYYFAKRGHTHVFEILSTGSLVLDNLLNGGIPTGHTICLLGEAQNGKTTFIFMMIESLLRNGKRVLYVNTEGKIDYKYLFRTIGYPEDTDPNSREFFNRVATFNQNEQIDTYAMVMHMIVTRAVDVVFIDSISSFAPKDYENEVDSPNFAAATKTNNSALPNLANACFNNNVLLCFTAQYRTDVMAHSMLKGTPKFERKSIRGGRRVIEHGTSLIIEFSTITSDFKGKPDFNGERYAYLLKARILKAQTNRLVKDKTATTLVLLPNATPYYDTASEIVDIGGLTGLFTDKKGEVIDHQQSGAKTKTHFYKGVALGNRQGAIDYIRDNDELRKELYEVVRQNIIKGNTITVTGVPSSFDEIEYEDEDMGDEPL